MLQREYEPHGAELGRPGENADKGNFCRRTRSVLGTFDAIPSRLSRASSR